MPKKRCPACGSTNTVKIIYGMPTNELFEAAERGEYVLCGCCLSQNNPTRHCKACGQDFGGEDLLPWFEMTSFEFFVGGYFGTSHFIYIDGELKNKIIKYAQTPGGMFADLKNPKNKINLHPDIKLKEIPLTIEQWIAFIEGINALKVAYWKDKYYDNDICDGTQWELIIKISHHDKIRKCGSNKYPPYWKTFIKILKKYIDENIG